MSKTSPSKQARNAATVKSIVYMVADEREREVIPFIEEAFQKNEYLVKTISIGDYIVLRKSSDRAEPTTLAVFERKTYNDYAAGFKDGRYENLSKMLALRARTGCQVYFIIEGPAFPSPNRKFGRIPFSSIESAITKSMVRHGAMIIHTENQQHTAKRLADFVAAMDVETSYRYPVEAPIDGAETGEADPAVTESENLMLVPEGLTARIEETDLEAAIKSWSRLRGVSVVLGRILTDHFSFVELVTGKVAKATIEGMKTATGRTINKDAKTNLLALIEGEEEQAAKVLSGVRGVGPAMATLMIKHAGGVKRLLSFSPASMGMIAIPQKNRTAKLGETRAERLLKVLSYKKGVEPSPVAAAAAVKSSTPKPLAKASPAKASTAATPAKATPAKAAPASKPHTATSKVPAEHVIDVEESGNEEADKEADEEAGKEADEEADEEAGEEADEADEGENGERALIEPKYAIGDDELDDLLGS